MSTAQPKARRRFPGLDPSALQHPYDRAALGALQRVPGIDIVVRKFIELFPERVAYIQNVAQTVRVSQTQCSQLYTLLQEACTILDVRQPELYVANYPAPNAYTSGHDHPYIVVTTGLLDLMNEVVQNPDVMLSTMMKFAGGTLFQRQQMDAREFLKQADLYEEVDSNILDRLYKAMLVSGVNHPLTIVRAREIMNWSESREYHDLLEGRYPRKPSAGQNGNTTSSTNAEKNSTGQNTNTTSSAQNTLIRCPHCGRDQMNQRFCSFCGGAIS